jgi:DNA-binding response OmpR family regulator
MTNTSAPAGRSVLVAEDEALISVLLSDDLSDAGYLVAGPFSCSADALAWLAANKPDVAILDYMLRDGPCTALAAALRTGGVPFIVFSAYRPARDVPLELQGVPWFDKPVSAETLFAALATL